MYARCKPFCIFFFFTFLHRKRLWCSVRMRWRLDRFVWTWFLAPDHCTWQEKKMKKEKMQLQTTDECRTLCTCCHHTTQSSCSTSEMFLHAFSSIKDPQWDMWSSPTCPRSSRGRRTCPHSVHPPRRSEAAPDCSSARGHWTPRGVGSPAESAPACPGSPSLHWNNLYCGGQIIQRVEV